MYFNGKDLENMRERNCENCRYSNTKYKILTCKLLNKQTTKEYCCVLHFFKEGGK